MKRIAAPMVGGMVSSSILTLLVIPAIYSLWRQREVRSDGGDAPRAEQPEPYAPREADAGVAVV
jgi:Cu(I)/Ag(I) efflux system membrane protein CusA/SilA